MRFRCPSCGIDFDDIGQLAAHKRQHQSVQQEASSGPKSITCLNCAKQIPLDPSQYNYSGPMSCPHCHRNMKVTLRDGEVVVARTG